jgi:hypothetical protein
VLQAQRHTSVNLQALVKRAKPAPDRHDQIVDLSVVEAAVVSVVGEASRATLVRELSGEYGILAAADDRKLTGAGRRATGLCGSERR